MTESIKKERLLNTGRMKAERITGIITSYIAITAVILFAVFLAPEAAEYVKDGLRLAVLSVLPASLPFMVISDMYLSFGHPERLYPFSSLLKRLFGISDASLVPLIAGNIGGFPIGARLVARLYLDGEIEKEEAESVIALSSSPSFAFIIGAVGVGLWNDLRVGLLFLIILYISKLTVGVICRKSRHKTVFKEDNSRQSFDLVESVKSSATASVSLIAFISLFSVIVGIAKRHLRSRWLIYAVAGLCEVTGALSLFRELYDMSPLLSFILSGASLGFGGLSVLLQSSHFTREASLSLKPYLLIKLLEGVVCGALSGLGYLIIIK